jgi:hypothetical protein
MSPEGESLAQALPCPGERTSFAAIAPTQASTPEPSLVPGTSAPPTARPARWVIAGLVAWSRRLPLAAAVAFVGMAHRARTADATPRPRAPYLRGLPRMKCAEAKQPEHADGRVYTFRGHGRRSTVEWNARTTSRTAVSRLSVVQSHVIPSSRATVTSSGTAPALTSGRECVIVVALTER